MNSLSAQSKIENSVNDQDNFVMAQENNIVLKLHHVGLQLKDVNEPLLENCHYSLTQGKFLIILGANGSGKSTLIKLINRTLPPTSGEIEFNGRPLFEYSAAEFSKKVITLSQDPSQSLFYELTVLENCLIFESRFHYQISQISMRSHRSFYAEYLNDYHPNLTQRLDIPVSRLSGGERQALLLALSARVKPELLLLDEHTAALDPKQASLIMERTARLVNSNQITAIMTTHNLDHVLHYGDQIIAIKAGKIIFSASLHEKQKLTKEDLLQYCY